MPNHPREIDRDDADTTGRMPPAQTDDPDAPHCPGCGRKIDAEDVICPHCGRAVAGG